MNPEHDPLEAELGRLKPRQPTPQLEERIAETFASEQMLTNPRRKRGWPPRLAIAGGLAAAVIIVAFFAWNRNVEIPPAEPGTINPPLAVIEPTNPTELLPNLQGYRRALAQSPEALEELLDKQSANIAPRSMPVTAFIRANSEFPYLNGDL